MKLILYWEDILHYHVARIEATCKLGAIHGNNVFPIALRSGSPEIPVDGYHDLLNGKIEVLASNPNKGSVNSADTVRKMIKRLDEVNADAVAIVGYENLVALNLLIWCRRRKRGAILMTESQASDFRRSVMKEYYKKKIISYFDCALVGGKHHQAYAKELGFTSDQIFMGYDVVDNNFWSTKSKQIRSDATFVREKLGLPHNYFLTVCRLVAKKNVAGLLRAYAAYAKKFASDAWPLVIAGDGPLMNKLKKYAYELNLTDKIFFLGYLSSKDMIPIYALASVFILASSHSEQWGLVVNEAMAAGIPVVVSKICGCVDDLVVEGQTGFVFDPQREIELIELLCNFSAGKVDISSMGRAAEKRISYYSPELFATNLWEAAKLAIQNANVRTSGFPFLVYPFLAYLYTKK